jgi:hypothetical protein
VFTSTHGLVAHVAGARVRVCAVGGRARRAHAGYASLRAVAKASIVAVGVDAAAAWSDAVERERATLSERAPRVIADVLTGSVCAAEVPRARDAVVTVFVARARVARGAASTEEAALPHRTQTVVGDSFAYAADDAGLFGAGDSVVAVFLPRASSAVRLRRGGVEGAVRSVDGRQDHRSSGTARDQREGDERREAKTHAHMISKTKVGGERVRAGFARSLGRLEVRRGIGDARRITASSGAVRVVSDRGVT